MSGHVDIPAGKLGLVLRARALRAREEIRKATLTAAIRGKALLVQKTPVDQGQVKNAWIVNPGRQSVSIENDAPHAGIIERGARPHGVNAEGIEALREWARRKVVTMLAEDRRSYGPGRMMKYRRLTRREAQGDPRIEAVVWGIVNKLKREGQKGTYFVRGSIPELKAMLDVEIKRAVKAHFGKAYTPGEETI